MCSACSHILLVCFPLMQLTCRDLSLRSDLCTVFKQLGSVRIEREGGKKEKQNLPLIFSGQDARTRQKALTIQSDCC